MNKKQWFIVVWILAVYIDYYVRFFRDPYMTPFLKKLLDKAALW